MTDIKDNVFDAVERGDVAVLRSLASKHGSEAVRADDNPDEMTALHVAAACGSVEAVGYLLSDEIGADVAALRGNDFSPLHAAAMNGHANVCAMLLEAGAPPDVQTDRGYSPLHSAAWAGYAAAVEVLLSHGARTDLRNYRDETPLGTAIRQGQVAVIGILDPRNATDSVADKQESVS